MNPTAIKALARKTGIGDFLARAAIARRGGRLGLRLTSAFLPLQGIRQKTIGSSVLTLDISEHIQRHVYMGSYEPIETGWIRSFLRPGMTFVDVGANIGYFSFVASDRVGHLGKVVAFEPEPAAFSSLLASVLENGLEGSIHAINSAVGDHRGIITLYRPPVSYGNNDASQVPYLSDMTAFEAPMTTLSQIVRSQNLENIDLLKIDVEGGELLVLKGAADLAKAKKIEAVLCECNPNLLKASGHSEQELNDWFQDNGFVLKREIHAVNYSNRFYELKKV